MTRLLSFALVSVMTAWPVRAQPPAADGIAWLTKDAHAQAVECGYVGEECAIAPYELCPSFVNGYSARIVTPFSRVAASVMERQRLSLPFRAVERGSANRWGVAVYVSPGENYDEAGSIRHVVLQRDGRTIEPLKATVAPVTINRSDGAMKRVAKGYFAFPIEALSPSDDVTVVLIGGARDVRCTLSRDRLLTLR